MNKGAECGRGSIKTAAADVKDPHERKHDFHQLALEHPSDIDFMQEELQKSFKPFSHLNV